jgi:hypothetical protein
MPNAAVCILLASALFVQAIAQPPPLPAHLAADAAAIIALANSSNTNGWDRLADWVDLHGARLSGSSQLEKALDYALAAMRSDGFDNVHEEIVNVTRWSRGEESLKMVAPYNKTLNFLSIGSSVGTSGAAIARLFWSFHHLTSSPRARARRWARLSYSTTTATGPALEALHATRKVQDIGLLGPTLPLLPARWLCWCGL